MVITAGSCLNLKRELYVRATESVQQLCSCDDYFNPNFATVALIDFPMPRIVRDVKQAFRSPLNARNAVGRDPKDCQVCHLFRRHQLQ